MKKKKQKKQKKIFGEFYSPYATENKKNMTEWYEANLLDSEKYLVIDDRVYSKIIYSCEFYVYDPPALLVAVDSMDKLRIGDILEDEQGREFTIKAFEMFHFVGEIPEWDLRVSHIVIQGKDYSIGEFLRKKHCNQ